MLSEVVDIWDYTTSVSAASHSAVPGYTAWWQRHQGVNNLLYAVFFKIYTWPQQLNFSLILLVIARVINATCRHFYQCLSLLFVGQSLIGVLGLSSTYLTCFAARWLLSCYLTGMDDRSPGHCTPAAAVLGAAGRRLVAGVARMPVSIHRWCAACDVFCRRREKCWRYHCAGGKHHRSVPATKNEVW